MLKIYLAEDQVMIAQALKTLLELEDDLKVIGTATDGKQALKDIIALKPDIALLDIEMPSLTGLEVATRTGAKIVMSNRVWAQLDTLLTSDTITEAMEISKARNT